MEATNTCGESGPQEYCIQTGYSNRKSCENTCNQGDHSPTYLTDLHEPQRQTWWQSETMFEGIQHPSQVNLTLHLGNFYIEFKFETNAVGLLQLQKMRFQAYILWGFKHSIFVSY